MMRSFGVRFSLVAVCALMVSVAIAPSLVSAEDISANAQGSVGSDGASGAASANANLSSSATTNSSSLMNSSCIQMFGLLPGTGTNSFFTPAVCSAYADLIRRFHPAGSCSIAGFSNYQQAITELNPQFAVALDKMLTTDPYLQGLTIVSATRTKPCAAGDGSVAYNSPHLYGCAVDLGYSASVPTQLSQYVQQAAPSYGLQLPLYKYPEYNHLTPIGISACEAQGENTTALMTSGALSSAGSLGGISPSAITPQVSVSPQVTPLSGSCTLVTLGCNQTVNPFGLGGVSASPFGLGGSSALESSLGMMLGSSLFSLLGQQQSTAAQTTQPSVVVENPPTQTTTQANQSVVSTSTQSALDLLDELLNPNGTSTTTTLLSLPTSSPEIATNTIGQLLSPTQTVATSSDETGTVTFSGPPNETSGNNGTPGSNEGTIGSPVVSPVTSPVGTSPSETTNPTTGIVSTSPTDQGSASSSSPANNIVELPISVILATLATLKQALIGAIGFLHAFLSR